MFGFLVVFNDVLVFIACNLFICGTIIPYSTTNMEIMWNKRKNMNGPFGSKADFNQSTFLAIAQSAIGTVHPHQCHLKGTLMMVNLSVLF